MLGGFNRLPFNRPSVSGIIIDKYVLLSDTGEGTDSIVSISVNLTIQDVGVGVDRINPAKVYYLIDSDSTLQPLGLVVLLDSRQDLLPALKEYVEEIPGRDGEIYLGSNYQSRLLELHVVGKRDREIVKFLNPKNGAQPLVFYQDIDKTYHVKYAGQIPITQYPDWMEFTIPFKMVEPFITGSFENIHTGSGTIVNSGTVETPLIIEITNTINPTIIIGNTELSYSGEISGTLIVDTKNLTVELNGENVLHNWSGGFPKLQPGETEVTADNSVTFKWRDRWC